MMPSREVQVVGVIAVFVVVVGIGAAAIVWGNEAATDIREHLWFRITSSDNETSTLATVYICDANNRIAEYFIYRSDGQWQSTENTFRVGEIFRIMIQLWDVDGYVDTDYRIGRGPFGADSPPLIVEIVSYWEMPDY